MLGKVCLVFLCIVVRHFEAHIHASTQNEHSQRVNLDLKKRDCKSDQLSAQLWLNLLLGVVVVSSVVFSFLISIK